MHTGAHLGISVPLRSCLSSAIRALQKGCRSVYSHQTNTSSMWAGEAAPSLGEALLHCWAGLQFQTPRQHPALPTPSPTRSRWHCKPSRAAQFKARTNSSAKLHCSISCLHCSQHTFLNRHIFVHFLFFAKPKNLIGRNLPTPKTRASKAPCFWELSLAPSRENHSSLQWLLNATTAGKPNTPSPQCLEKGATARASPSNTFSHCPGECQASH